MRKLLFLNTLLALALLLPSGARAAAEQAPTPPPTEAPPSASTETLKQINGALKTRPGGGAVSAPAPGKDSRSTQTVISEDLAASTVPLTADQVVDRLERSDQALASLHCRFTQALKIPGYGINQKGAGELWFKKEKKLRIEQTEPHAQTVIFDGERIWIYSAETNQVLEQDWSAFAQSQMLSRSLAQFGSYTKLRERYKVEASTEPSLPGGPPLYRVTLRPKEVQEIPYRLDLIVGPPDYIPRRTKMTLNDTEVETALSDVTVNPTLGDKTFAFEAPSGATVIRPGAKTP
jgi:outer membrane lipoprotein-sorting protein